MKRKFSRLTSSRFRQNRLPRVERHAMRCFRDYSNDRGHLSWTVFRNFLNFAKTFSFEANLCFACHRKLDIYHFLYFDPKQLSPTWQIMKTLFIDFRAVGLIDMAPSANSFDDIDVHKTPHYPRPIKVNKNVLLYCCVSSGRGSHVLGSSNTICDEFRSNTHPGMGYLCAFAFCIISGLEKAIFLCCKHVYDAMWSLVAGCSCWRSKHSLRVHRNDLLKCDNIFEHD